MAVETVAPAPAGVQAPAYVPPQTQEPLKVKAGDKYKEAFDKLTKDTSPEKEESKDDTGKSDILPTKPEEKTEEKPVVSDSRKPESPLDAVLSKVPREEKTVEEPDVLKEFDDVKTPVSEHWQKLKGIAKKQADEKKSLQARLDELAKAPKYDSNVVEALTKERDDLRIAYERQEQNLKAINAEYSDEFQGLLKQKESIVGKISSRVKAYGGDANALVEALALPEGKIKTAQIKEALAELDPDDKPRIHALIETLESHDEKIADFKKDLPKKWDEIQARRDVQLQEQGALQLKNLETQYGKVTERLPELSVTFRELPDDDPGASEWNKEIRDALQGGLAVLKPDGADFEASAIIAAKGQRYDSLEKRLLALHSDYKELKKQYAELSGAGPDFKGGGKPTTKVEKKPGAKYHEALATFQGAGLGEV